MQIRLSVQGMSCGHCAGAVREALAGVVGVTQVIDVSVERAEAIVEGDADADQLVAAVTAAGYETRVA